MNNYNGHRAIAALLALCSMVCTHADTMPATATFSAARNGAITKVYTFRTYADGINGGALPATVLVTESVPGALRVNSALQVNLRNAAAGATAAGVTTLGSPVFANASGSGGNVLPSAVISGAPGYSMGAAVFTPGSYTYNVNTASTTLLSNTLSLGALTIGPQAGPVTVGLISDSLGAVPEVTIAQAVNASNTSITGAIANAVIAGAAVTLPTITVTESAAGALQTQAGGAGQVSLTLSNGGWDVAASQSATWCGVVLPANSLSGSGTASLTVSLPTVSKEACALVVNGKAAAALTAAPGAAIAVAVNIGLSDNGQATRQWLQVATVDNTGCSYCHKGGLITTTVTTADKPTGLVFAPNILSSTADQGMPADAYVIAYYQGIFLYKQKTPAGCAGWTVFFPQTGSIPRPYESGLTLGVTNQLGNINDCDVTALKGVSYYDGYGVGIDNLSTWNSMLVHGTFSNSPIFLTN